MGRVIADKACRVCQSKGGDKTGNHCMVFEDQSGYCNRCKTYYSSDELKNIPQNVLREKTQEEIDEEIADANNCPVGAISRRAIDLAASERFGFRTGVSPTDGTTVTSCLFPRHRNGKLVGYKVKLLTQKKFYHIGSCRDTDLVGIQEAVAHDTYKGILFVTEDDLSMASVYQAVQKFTKESHKRIKPAVVALPDGSDLQGSKLAHLFEKHKEEIAQFKEIIMVMDNDEAGEAGSEKAAQLFPDRVKVAKLPLKDPNDMYMAKREYELYNAVRFNAEVKRPDGAIDAVNLIEAALEPPKEGESYPWQGLFDIVVGQRMHEVTTIGGGSGCGKSTIAYELASYNITKLNRKVAMFPLEEQPVKAFRHVVGRYAGSNFNNPRVTFKKELFLKSANEIAPSLTIWDNKGASDWCHIKEAIRWMYLTKGVTIFFVDNVTVITSHLSPSEINTEIGRISKDVAELVNEFPIHIYVFSHLNPPKSGPSHEEGGQAKAVQLTGSRHLQRYSHNIWMN